MSAQADPSFRLPCDLGVRRIDKHLAAGCGRERAAWVEVLRLSAAALRLRASESQDPRMTAALLLLRVELLERAGALDAGAMVAPLN
jgi:hypothetical protein